MIPRIVLKHGKDKPVLAHHPWIFSGAIARADDASDGDAVDVLDASDRWIARGYYNSRSQIAVRIWTWNDEPIDRGWMRSRLQQAIAARAAFVDQSKTNAYRLVNAESDGLPGLVVDRYGDFVVVQCLTLGIEKIKAEIGELVAELLEPRGVYERSDVDVREKEGLPACAGPMSGEEPPARLEIRENGLRFWVDVRAGHKTGFYLDQRENRERVARYFAQAGAHRGGAYEVLNVFSYTGAFAVYVGCAAPGARVVNLDTSADALELARENLRLNGLEATGEFVEADAFQKLRRFRDERRTFDAIILDPPKFVHSQAQLAAGLRGYKDVNLLAFKLLKPGGWLATFSCSGQVSAELLQKVVFGAAVDAGREAQIVAKLSQAPDHPIRLAFPESEYLKGLVCRAA